MIVSQSCTSAWPSVRRGGETILYERRHTRSSYNSSIPPTTIQRTACLAYCPQTVRQVSYSTERFALTADHIDLFEAKAILLGRLGRHDSALEVYVYRLQDFLKAEEYCKRIYRPNSPTANIFLTLLRIYLLPSPSAPPAANLLPPALELISRHSPRLDPVATLQLLPPLVTGEDVSAFLLEALREPLFDTRVVRNVHKAREEQVARRLIALQSKRVRITESRM